MGYIPPAPATREGETKPSCPSSGRGGPGFLGFFLRIPLLFFFLGYCAGKLFWLIVQ